MKLIAVTNDQHSVKHLSEIIISNKDKFDFVQIREKNKKASEIMILLDALQEGGVDKKKIIINDRLDIALLQSINNVHLPEQGLPIKIVKKHYPHLSVGCSVHSIEKAREMEKAGADYLLYGHCFKTDSKKGLLPNGIEPLKQMKKDLKIPVYAIGGITLEKVPIMKQLSVDGIAVMSSIFSAEDPKSVTKKFMRRLHD